MDVRHCVIIQNEITSIIGDIGGIKVIDDGTVVSILDTSAFE